MKNQILRHLLFWLACILQNTLLEYAWIHSTLSYRADIIYMAIAFNLALLPSKILFTYFALYILDRDVIKERKKTIFILLKTGAGLFVAIVLHRIGSVYYIHRMEFPNEAVSYKHLFIIPWMLVSLLDIGYGAGLAVALRLFRMKMVNLKTEKELVKDKLETELKFLKTQINPHFLFNTLNNIYALSRKKSDKAPEIVIRLSKLLRFMLYETSKPSIPIAEELLILDDYLHIEKIRYHHIKLAFEKQVDDYTQPIGPLILLPFIENAFKHGTSGTNGDFWITIKLALHNGQLEFKVTNSCTNQENEKIKENIGLANVRRQLELMYKEFTLVVGSLEHCFCVDLRINLFSNKGYANNP